ncbi:MAG: aminotransferase class III-fold pyridoxal phosphate-dependent enzyme [Patescibacteria group bacterium]
MKRRTLNSKRLLERAKKVIPRASQTLSKSPDQFVEGVSPYAIIRGKGCEVWDVDGNKYIDLASSLGAIILGYQHPLIERSVLRQRQKGTIFSIPGDLEVVLAEKIVGLLPYIEMVRFGLNGSDVTTAAIRVARAYTGRDHVAKCGYHGWPDWAIATNPLRNRGIPEAVKNLSHEFKYNDLPSLEKILNDYPNQIAAIILEPVSSALPHPGFLEGIKILASKHKAVLVFDELVTGFRLAMGGAAEYFGVIPDLVCYGKAISNGEPLSVLGGKREIMATLNAGDIFFSFTYAGYLPSIAAALATLDFMKRNNIQKRLWETGNLLIKNYNALANEYKIPTKAVGIGPHPVFVFKDNDGNDDLVLKSLFIQETAKAGILTSCSNVMNYSHTTSHIAEVSRRLEKVFAIMSSALKNGKVGTLLEGPVIKPRNKPV